MPVEGTLLWTGGSHLGAILPPPPPTRGHLAMWRHLPVTTVQRGGEATNI